MKISVRFIGLCLSSLFFVALLGYVLLPTAVAQPNDVICPCDFDASIQEAPECWDVHDFGPIFSSPLDTPPSNGCMLFAGELISGDELLFDVREKGVLGNQDNKCQVKVQLEESSICGPNRNITHEQISDAELKACQCQLQAYATALNEGGTGVEGGPPYLCAEDIDCTPEVCCIFGKNNCEFISQQECEEEGGKFTEEDVACSEVKICNIVFTPIPTLNQWGLIAMAAILGIIGFIMVLRRRKATA